MTEHRAACQRLAAELQAAGAFPAEVDAIRLAYAAALSDADDRSWRAFYLEVFAALLRIEPTAPRARAAYGRLAALADDDLGAALLAPQTAERLRARLVEAA